MESKEQNRIPCRNIDGKIYIELPREWCRTQGIRHGVYVYFTLIGDVLIISGESLWDRQDAKNLASLLDKLLQKDPVAV